MDLPLPLLEKIFLYLEWNDRARVARVCRQWLAAFHSPVLWRKITFKPPSRRLTRFQYDMKCYFLSCCLRAVGCYIREYEFLESDDIFLLNRILSMIAKFLESNIYDDADYDNDDDISAHGQEENPTLYQESLRFGDQTQQTHNSTVNYFGSELECEVEQTVDTSYGFTIEGDPDAEATLKLVLRLQEKELFGLSSDSSDEDIPDVSPVWNENPRYRSFSTSEVPGSSYGQMSHRVGKPYQRSMSCKYPTTFRTFIRSVHPPAVLNFQLDFHCEVDDYRGFAYGTGGALLSTIRRVMRQLTKLRRLRLTNLFLTALDARNLILDLSAAASHTLLELNITHLHKPPVDITAALMHNPTAELSYADFPNTSERTASNKTMSDSGLKDWYLLDSRWLGARPNRFNHNPLADLAHLFPCILRLILSPVQLTGPMLLRMLFRTTLREICLVQTDLTPFTLSRSVAWNQNPQQLNQMHPDELDHHVDLSFSEEIQQHPDLEDMIDWCEDVPLLKRTNRNPPVDFWRPISPKMWRSATILRPDFYVSLHLRLSNNLTHIRWHANSSEQESAPFAHIRSFWPVWPAPVRNLTLVTDGDGKFISDLLGTTNPYPIISYTNLTTLIIISEPSSSSPTLLSDTEVIDSTNQLDKIIHTIFDSCPALALLAFGGTNAYMHVLTLLTLCRQLSQRRNSTSELAYLAFNLLVQKECCLLTEINRDNLSATISAWYSSIIDEPENTNCRYRAAECCICTALDQPRWHFLSHGEFQSNLHDYLV